MNYRPEIDGLRALAILPVILYHAFPELCPGGFLGVDVFFVISGFLITRIIFEEVRRGQFSVQNFYARRIRRILPALYFMLILCSLFYLLVARPSNQESELLGGSVLSVVGFFSNIYFAQNTGYFANSADLVPFLHTWSLAVEEQFYLIYPFLFLLAFRFGKTTLSWVIIAVACLSFVFAHLGFELLGKWNFYLLPTRGWEIAAGAMCFLLNRRETADLPKIIYEGLVLIGLFLVLFSFFYLNQSIQSPGLWCLFPVLGTMFVITFCKPGQISHVILSFKGLAYIGLISYGAYLWHHPILSLCRHFVIHPSHLPITIIWIAVLTSLLLGSLSFHFVEKPFREKKLSVRWLIIPMLVLLGLGFFPKEISTFGINPRNMAFSESVRDLARDNYDSDRGEKGYYFGDLSQRGNDLLLLGDSHARMLIPSLGEMCELKKWRGFHPYEKKFKTNFLAINPNTEESFLKAWRKQMKIESDGAKAILISFRHSRSKDNYFYDTVQPDLPQVFFDNFESRVLYLSSLVPKILIVAPFPESPFWGPNIGRSFLQRENWFDTSVSKYISLHQKLLNHLEKIASVNSSFQIIYPHHFLSNQDAHFSYFFSGERKSIIPYYYDDDHLNKFGCKEIAQEIISEIQ